MSNSEISKLVKQPGQGELINMYGPTAGSIRLLVDPKNSGDDAGLCVLIQTLDEGAAVPPHRHDKAEQVLYFVGGTGAVSLLGVEVSVEPGTVVFVPKGTDHAIFNRGEGSLSFLEATTPPGFENAFREMGGLPDAGPAEIAEIAARHDILISQPEE
jgi:mannose-6-phosphate isomerase-like protein (cupin superfamily)